MADTITFFIPGPTWMYRGSRKIRTDGHHTFPSLNEYMTVCNRSYHGQGHAKKDLTEWCYKYAHRAKLAEGWVTPKGQVSIELEFVEPNRKRDADNIAFASKFILDGLTWPRDKREGNGHMRRADPTERVIVYDSQAYVPQPPHSTVRVALDEVPGVWVTVTKLNNGGRK